MSTFIAEEELQQHIVQSSIHVSCIQRFSVRSLLKYSVHTVKRNTVFQPHLNLHLVYLTHDELQHNIFDVQASHIDLVLGPTGT